MIVVLREESGKTWHEDSGHLALISCFSCTWHFPFGVLQPANCLLARAVS